MRLLKSSGGGRYVLEEYGDDNIPPYAILSHTWGRDVDEVTYKDLVDGTGVDKAGYDKLRFCEKQTARNGLSYFWVDTCSIDKSSSAELTESLNSMFKWYRNAARCYVYLPDVSIESAGDVHSPEIWAAAFRESRWFTRGWTLQELIAPGSVEFFSKEGDCLGNRPSLEHHISTVTRIPVEALRGTKQLSDFTVEERFAWAETRETKRPEDMAYSLLGIFDVFMPLLYGEGKDKALSRLKQEIDRSLKVSEGTPGDKLPASSMVPFRPDVDFIDRKARDGNGTLLEQIEQLCSAPAARVALVGMGGSGKSQLAIEYCHRLRKQSPYTWIFWVHASNVERVEQGYREIAEQLQIPGRDDPYSDVFELVARWLRDQRNGRWLLVLDNADNEVVLSAPQEVAAKAAKGGDSGQSHKSLSAYLPQSMNGILLVTTRTRSIANKLVEPRDILEVDVLAKDDAVALLRKKLRPTDELRDLEDLADVLECMPLALVQAAAFIHQKRATYRIQQYVEAFQRSDKRKASLLNHEAGHLRRDTEAKNSIIVTWQISFDDIRKQRRSAADLLSLMSYFDRQGIPIEVLTIAGVHPMAKKEKRSKGKEREQDSDEDSTSDSSDDSDSDPFEDDIDCLRNYSFISSGVADRTFEMHALVQLATRKWLEMHKENEFWKGEFCHRLNKAFPSGGYENWRKCDRLFPHAKAAEQQQPTGGDKALRDWAAILRNAGDFASDKGQYFEAERMITKSVKELEKTFGDEDRDTLKSMNNQGSVFRNLGWWTDAAKVQVHVMETGRRVLGPEHHEVLSVMNNLAITYRHLARWEDAENTAVTALEIRQRILRKDHPDTLSTMNNLVAIYRNQGRWSKAEKMGLEVLDTRLRILGEDHPKTLVSMNNLATIYRHQGRLDEAEKLKLRVMHGRRKVLGDEHPLTLASMNNLASAYRDQQRWDEAEQIDTQVLAARQRILGEEHPRTLASMNNLAGTLWTKGRTDEALKLLSDCVELTTRVQGADHPDAVRVTARLANWQRKQR